LQSTADDFHLIFVQLAFFGIQVLGNHHAQLTPRLQMLSFVF